MRITNHTVFMRDIERKRNNNKRTHNTGKEETEQRKKCVRGRESCP